MFEDTNVDPIEEEVVEGAEGTEEVATPAVEEATEEEATEEAEEETPAEEAAE